MKKSVHRGVRVLKSFAGGIFVLLILTPIISFAQSRENAVRSVNALLNVATRSDREDRNRGTERERFTLPDRASPMAHAVLGAIAQTAGSPDTINRGQRADAIHEAMSGVIQPSEIAANVIHEDKGFKDDNERAEKITQKMSKAIEEKLSSHNDFKLAAIDEKKDFIEKEREQKFEEKFGDRSKKHSERSDLVSQITNFNDGKEGKSKELERLAFNKSDNGRSGKGGGGGSGSDKAQAKSDNAQVAKADNAQAGGGGGGGADAGKSDDKKSDDKKEDKGKK